MHARCLSVYVKNQFKENKSFKCPSCAWPLWVQQQISSNSNDTIQPDLNELSPVALQLYNHLLNHGKWWGQALIKNTNVRNNFINLLKCLLLLLLLIIVCLKDKRY